MASPIMPKAATPAGDDLHFVGAGKLDIATTSPLPGGGQDAENPAQRPKAHSGFLREVGLGAKLKIRAEWWACSDQGTAIVAIGVSQWGVQPQADRFGRLTPVPPNDYETEYSVQRIIYNVLCA